MIHRTEHRHRTPGSGRRAALLAAAGVVAGSSLGLAGEILWVSHRRLPVLDEVDASGLVPGKPGLPPLRLVVLGDSTLTGPGLTSSDELWLRRALVELDLERPVEVISLAVSGSRVADVLARVDEALATRADVAVVAVGSNDAIHGTPSAQFARSLDDVLARLLSQIAVVAVSNVGDLGNIARVPRPLTTALRTRGRTICRRVEHVVAGHDRAVLLDVTAVDAHFRDRSVYSADLFHPNPVGHTFWASAAVPGLRRALRTLEGAH